jgi:uncharacterized protein (TIGR02266 family)
MADCGGRAIDTFVERRRSPRAPLVVRVDYSSVDVFFSEFSRDINEGGLFIATDRGAELDAPVQLQFSLPGSEEPLKVAARVTRVSNGESGEPRGLGVEFAALDPETRERINRLVLELRARG